MLAWSTEMNTITKLTLAKIWFTLEKRYTIQKKAVSFLTSWEYHFYQKANKIKHQFFHFCTLFYHILQIHLNTCFCFLENYHKCNISMRLENFRARKHYYLTLVSAFFFQIKAIICNSLWLTFMKWITLMAWRFMNIPKIKIF